MANPIGSRIRTATFTNETSNKTTGLGTTCRDINPNSIYFLSKGYIFSSTGLEVFKPGSKRPCALSYEFLQVGKTDRHKQIYLIRLTAVPAAGTKTAPLNPLNDSNLIRWPKDEYQHPFMHLHSMRWGCQTNKGS